MNSSIDLPFGLQDPMCFIPRAVITSDIDTYRALMLPPDVLTPIRVSHTRSRQTRRQCQRLAVRHGYGDERKTSVREASVTRYESLAVWTVVTDRLPELYAHMFARRAAANGRQEHQPKKPLHPGSVFRFHSFCRVRRYCVHARQARSA
jgi:hypothetical protein